MPLESRFNMRPIPYRIPCTAYSPSARYGTGSITRSPGAPIYFHLLCIMVRFCLVSVVFSLRLVWSFFAWPGHSPLPCVCVYVNFSGLCFLSFWWVCCFSPVCFLSCIFPLIYLVVFCLLSCFCYSCYLLFLYFYQLFHLSLHLWFLTLALFIFHLLPRRRFSVSPKSWASSPLLCKAPSPAMTTSVLISNAAIYMTSSFIYLALNYSLLPTEGRGKGGRGYLREVTHYRTLASSLPIITHLLYSSSIHGLCPFPILPSLHSSSCRNGLYDGLVSGWWYGLVGFSSWVECGKI